MFLARRIAPGINVCFQIQINLYILNTSYPTAKTYHHCLKIVITNNTVLVLSLRLKLIYGLKTLYEK